jgi:hypothetical protein
MSLHPVRSTAAAEHNRRHAFAQAVVLALCLFVVSIIAASASDSGTAAVNLLPLKAQHRGIVLKSQTVDAIINEEQGKVWADTRVWLKLHNPASKPITVSVTLPGPQMSPVPLPADLDVHVGNTPLRLLPSVKADDGQVLSATAAIRIPARNSVDVTLTFRQALPDDQGVTTYTYPLSGADQWAGTPESLRVTVELKPPMSTSSILAITPPAHRSDAQTLTWDWESEWAQSKTNVGFAFMSPGWFAEFDAARADATGDEAGAGQHILLSKHYRRLASLSAVPFGTQTEFRTRYYPSAIAELQAALASNPSPIESAQAHSMLAELYVEQADQAQQGAREQYLQAAGIEVESAISSSAPESALRELAARIFGELSQTAEAAGDAATARDYRHRLEAVRASSQEQEGQTQAITEDLLRAAHFLEQGDTKAARDLIASRYGLGAAVLPAAPPPLVRHMLLTVTTTLVSRQITLYLGAGENLEEASELAGRTAEALRVQGGAQAIAEANKVIITLPGPPSADVFALQQALASSLPDAPELALLRSVLTDTRGSEATETSLLQSIWRYTEQVDLASALQHWEQIAAQLESAQSSSLQGLAPGQAEQLQHIQRALWDSDAAAWRRFAASSRVDYRFEQNTSDTNREWQVRAGEQREMIVQNSRWNLESIRWAALALCIVLAGLAALAWQLA